MSTRRIVDLLELLGICLVVLIGMFYMRQSLAQLKQLTERRLAHGNYTTVEYGDIMIRDLPKARSLMVDRFFDDPHYANEVNWYPFATPSIVSVMSRVTGSPPYRSYLYTGILSGGLQIIALALFLRFHFGKIGYILYPLLLSLGQYWPDNGYYPFQTARIPLLIYLFIAGVLFDHLASAKKAHNSNKILYLAISLGFVNGILGIWHGASFFIATLISMLVMVAVFVREVKRKQFRAATRAIVLFAFSLMLSISPLLLPQIIQYGHYQTADAARLWLADLYINGNYPEGLFSLQLLPAGIDLGILLLFLFSFLSTHRTRKYKLAPVLLGYLSAQTLAHLGFVVNSAEYPWLASLSRLILLAPPQTFHGISLDLLKIIRIIVFFMLIEFIVQQIRQRVSNFKNRPFMSKILQSTSSMIALAAAGTIFFFHHPPPSTLYISAIDRNTVQFANEVIKIIGPNETVIDANVLMGYAPIKILYSGSPQHSNPYADKERAEAQKLINSGNVASMNAVIEKYNIHYAVVNRQHPSMVSKYCSKETLLSSENSELQLISLTTCSLPN